MILVPIATNYYLRLMCTRPKAVVVHVLYYTEGQPSFVFPFCPFCRSCGDRDALIPVGHNTGVVILEMGLGGLGSEFKTVQVGTSYFLQKVSKHYESEIPALKRKTKMKRP